MRRPGWTALLLLAVVANAPSGFAQQPANTFRIGFLGPPASPPATSQLDVLRRELARLGYEEGRNVTIDSRWPEANRLDQLPAAAAALISTRPDVLVAVGATAARIAKEATSDLPIVFAGVVDPLATGTRGEPGKAWWKPDGGNDIRFRTSPSAAGNPQAGSSRSDAGRASGRLRSSRRPRFMQTKKRHARSAWRRWSSRWKGERQVPISMACLQRRNRKVSEQWSSCRRR